MSKSVMAIAAGFLVLSAATATAKPVSKCILKVDGKSYINGPCKYDPVPSWMGSGGFQITKDPWFADISIHEDEVIGWWNGDNVRGKIVPGSHAHSSLGPLHREGACFVGPRARVCAYR